MSLSSGRLLAGTLVAAIALPTALHLALSARLRRAEAHIGERVAIGGAEVGLTGTLTLSDVRVGDVIAVDTVEAAVGLTHLLAGRFVADEVRVERPRVAGGRDELAGLLERLSARRRHSAGAATAATGARRFRIVITGGELELDLGAHGKVRARDVELHPQEGGVRVVTGPSSAELRRGPWRADVGFARAGVDLELPSLRVRRAALDGGHASVSAGGPPLELADVVVVHAAETRVTASAGNAGKLAVTLDGDGLRVEATALPLGPFPAALPVWIEPTGRVGGTASLSRDGHIDAALRIDGARLDHPLVARVPLPFTGRVELRGAWDAATRAARGQVRVGLERVVLEADLDVSLDEAGEVRRARVAATLPEAPCADVLAAVPRELSAPLIGLDLTGELGGHVELAFDLARPDEARLDIDLGVGCQVARDESAAPVAELNGPYAHPLPDGHIRVLADSDPDFVALDDLPRHVWGAFVAAEDARFFQHDGFDAEQLRRSFTIDVAAGRVERGGSTISQQLVKNLYLTRERTLGRKLVEAVLTWNLEQRLDKRRILEAYLNVIELGNGVYGIGPAARRWFGKEAARLSPAEAAFLAAVTPAPRTAERTLGHAGRIDDAFLRRGEIVLYAMRRSAHLPRSEMREQLAALERLRLKVL